MGLVKRYAMVSAMITSSIYSLTHHPTSAFAIASIKTLKLQLLKKCGIIITYCLMSF